MKAMFEPGATTLSLTCKHPVLVSLQMCHC